MNDNISKKFVNLLIDNCRNNNINLMTLYYTNNKVFDIIFTFASIQYGMICYKIIIEVLQDEAKKIKDKEKIKHVL